MTRDEQEPCPACGGAGGGPFGRAGGAWDDESYVCPRCEGLGVVLAGDVPSQRPGLVKAAKSAAEAAERDPSDAERDAKKRAG